MLKELILYDVLIEAHMPRTLHASCWRSVMPFVGEADGVMVVVAVADGAALTGVPGTWRIAEGSTLEQSVRRLMFCTPRSERRTYAVA